MNIIPALKMAAFCSVAALVTGCAGYGNSALPDQGEAYHEMFTKQTANPERIVQDGHPPLDGAIAERVVKTYRADAADRGSVRNTIQVNVGGEK